MAHVNKTVLILHSAPQMFALVDDVASYPLFLPWCEKSEVIQQDSEITQATLFIHYYGVQQSFTTHNHKTPNQRMDLSLVDGPFLHLQGSWEFIALQESACKIVFTLEYTFKNTLLEKLIAPVFSHITDTFVDRFVARADALYAKD